MTGTVVRSPSPGRWIVRDDAGREHLVLSGASYRPGERVQVLDGFIVSPAGLPPPTRRYEV